MALFFFAVWRALKEHSYFIIGKFEILSPVGFGVFCALLAFRACVGGTTPSQNNAGIKYKFLRFFFDAKTTHNCVLAPCSAILDVTTT